MKRKSLYTIKDNNASIKFEVLETHNAWWKDRYKVERLLSAFKLDCDVTEAIRYAGITREQYQYFREVHTQFDKVKKILSSFPSLKARMSLIESFETNPRLAFKYLVMKRPEEFNKTNSKGDSQTIDLDQLSEEQIKQRIVNIEIKLAETDNHGTY